MEGINKIQTICICGGGTMGKGIAQVSARAGFSTILYELNPAVLQSAEEEMIISLQTLVDKGKLENSEMLAMLGRLHFTSDPDECRADFLIEAIVESLPVKAKLFSHLYAINQGKAIYASNTSSLSVRSMAEKFEEPGRLLGLHFFNPAPLMKLVELVITPHTNKEVIRTTMGLCTQMGKTAVICLDSPGFIVNRVARPYYIEALRLAEEGHSDLGKIDRILEATGFRMGPFKLMDLIGNDINYAVSQSVFDQLKQPERLRPSYLQKEKVDKNDLGRKTGKGYYEYP